MKQCIAKTADGNQCKTQAKPGTKYCGTHKGQAPQHDGKIPAPVLTSYDDINLFLEQIAYHGLHYMLEPKLLTALTAVAKEARLTLVAKADAPKGEQASSLSDLTDEELDRELEKYHLKVVGDDE